MIVSSFSDPIALICPPMVGRKRRRGRAALKLSGHIVHQRHAEQAVCLKSPRVTVSSVCDRNTPTSSPGRSRPGQLSLVCSRTLLGGSALPPRSPSSWCRAASDPLSVNVAGLFDESLRGYPLKSVSRFSATFCVSVATLRETPAT